MIGCKWVYNKKQTWDLMELREGKRGLVPSGSIRRSKGCLKQNLSNSSQDQWQKGTHKGKV